MDSDQFQSLIVRKLNNELSPNEIDTFEDLIKNQPHFKAQYEEAQSLWNTSAQYRLKYVPDAQSNWEDFQQLKENPQAKEVKIIPFVFRIAAAVALLIGVYFAIDYTNDPELISYTADNSTELVYLPDSSQVWLNAGSTLSFTEVFGEDARNCKLDGEAYFSVTHDKSRPFIVSSQQAKVQVLGTEFNVRSNDDGVEVSVSSGKVSLSHSDNAIILEKGMAGFYAKDKGSVTLVNFNSNQFSWHSDQLEFKDALLSEVITDLQKHFKVKIRLSNKSLSSCRYTGTFDEPTIEGVLKIISATLNISYQKTQGVYSLSGKGCQNNQ